MAEAKLRMALTLKLLINIICINLCWTKTRVLPSVVPFAVTLSEDATNCVADVLITDHSCRGRADGYQYFTVSLIGPEKLYVEVDSKNCTSQARYNLASPGSYSVQVVLLHTEFSHWVETHLLPEGYFAADDHTRITNYLVAEFTTQCRRPIATPPDRTCGDDDVFDGHWVQSSYEGMQNVEHSWLWKPSSCNLDTLRCAPELVDQCFHGVTLCLFGDSQTRVLALAMTALLSGVIFKEDHKEVSLVMDRGGFKLVYHRMRGDADFEEYLSAAKSCTVSVFNFGIWDLSRTWRTPPGERTKKVLRFGEMPGEFQRAHGGLRVFWANVQAYPVPGGNFPAEEELEVKFLAGRKNGLYDKMRSNPRVREFNKVVAKAAALNNVTLVDQYKMTIPVVKMSDDYAHFVYWTTHGKYLKIPNMVALNLATTWAHTICHSLRRAPACGRNGFPTFKEEDPIVGPRHRLRYEPFVHRPRGENPYIPDEPGPY